MAFDVKRFKVQRLWISGVLLAIAGPAVSLSSSTPALACALFFLTVAVVYVVSGSTALASLVRRVPIAAH